MNIKDFFSSKKDGLRVGKIMESAPAEPDLTNSRHAEWVKNSSEQLTYLLKTPETASQFEDFIYKNVRDRIPVLFLLALKNALSKLLVNRLKEPLKVSVIFAIYKEKERMQEKSAAFPLGENFLEEKVKQLQWLFKDNPAITAKIIAVDDGCPEQSGKEAERIIKEKQLPGISVLYLEDAIKNKLDIVDSLKSTSESQKGGSIVYGMWHAANQNVDSQHVIVYTDADLSTHLGQTGLLIDPIVRKNKKAAIGSRREERSVSIKKGMRNYRGKLFIFLWKKMLPQLDFITDTQCGFKAFDSQIVNKITKDMIEKKFAFDIELLLRTVLMDKNAVEIVPIVWIDSDEASTTKALSPYLSMLKQVARMQEKYTRPTEEARAFAEFVLGLDENQFHYLLEHIPEVIKETDPKEFHKLKAIGPEDLQKIINSRTKER